MPHIDNTGLLCPETTSIIPNDIASSAVARSSRRTPGAATKNLRDFERVQLLCRLGLPQRQFLPAVLPYFRELIPASCAFVIWNDKLVGDVSICRESPRAIVLETQTPRALEVQRALREHFSALEGRRCDLIPLNLIGLDGSESAYHPSITTVLAATLEDSQGLTGFLCLCRDTPARFFSFAEQTTLVQLAAQFTCALNCEIETAALLAISPESGLFIVNSDSQIQIACARAKNLLSMILVPELYSITKKPELPAQLQQRFTEILDPGKPTEAAWHYRNSWGGFLFHARLLRETINSASRSVAVSITREEPLSLQVFRKCRQLRLTARQTEIVLALTRGQSCPMIGRQLNISPHSVIDHVRKLCRQLEVPNRDTLVVRILT